jgi:hypothetical protein
MFSESAENVITGSAEVEENLPLRFLFKNNRFDMLNVAWTGGGV